MESSTDSNVSSSRETNMDTAIAASRVLSKQRPPFTIQLLSHPSEQSSTTSSSLGSTNSSSFSSTASELPPLETLLPASHRTTHNELQLSTLSHTYLSTELGLSQLEDFNQWFWLLSTPCLPRPLHDCAFLGREICITESMDRHLGLGKTHHLYLKPIPAILLDPRFWADYLPCSDGCHLIQPLTDVDVEKCPRRQLFECALGFLFSYTALVSHESDFHLAQAKLLIPPSVTWARWRVFAQQIISYPHITAQMHRRFLYGELRLQLLNEMAQLKHGAVLQVLVGRLDQFARFFQGNVRWLASLVAYLAIVLTALQVGLDTRALGDNETFQSFSYGFTLFSLVGPLGVMVAFGVYFGMYVSYYMTMNVVAAKRGEKMRQRKLRRLAKAGIV